MRPAFGILALALVALGLLHALVSAAPPPVPATAPAAPAATAKAPRPDHAVPQADCAQAGCHADVKAYKAVHGPVNVNACDACHKLADASRHQFTLTRDKTQICTFCHQMDTKGAKVVHKPVADGDCLACHNPHGGNDRHFTRGPSMRDTCDACHRDVVGQKKHLHGPVAAGACGGCHAPHTSDLPKLLIATGRDLCVTCHKEMDEQLHDAKVVHKPVRDDCMQCHDPHGSDYPMQVRKPTLDLCVSCHAEVRKAVADAPHKHSVVTSGAACLSCHTPHGGDLANLLRKKQVEVCLSCHDKTITTDQGRTIASQAGVLDPQMVKHGPIRDGDCGGCHNAHGGANTHLLAKPYPGTFYAKFDVQRYGLCFGCHDSQLVLTARTDSLTGFRNGQTNLHYVHVNRPDRGRTCVACHETHVSRYPMHIRASVPFGQWDMPINYTPTATGGSCAPGCHRTLAYDRVQPAANQPPAPATAPALDPRTTNTERNIP
jgi:predicted CXXCH cytochrome family protein